MLNAERQNILINQFLHGYDEGHRLIASSIKPKKRSSQLLLELSDSSGQSSKSNLEGYITGYPLAEMNAYAVARTWAAPEMPRPGCVWTHTLLIDFSDLAAIDSKSIVNLFRRPIELVDRHKYEIPLKPNYTPDAIGRHHLESHKKAIANLVESIYASPGKSIFAELTRDWPVDDITLAIWLQQWPRLRRSFRFCTNGPVSTSLSHDKFDLQFVAKRQIHINQKLRDEELWIALDELCESAPAWATTAADQIVLERSGESLQDFLWRYGADIESGRFAFRPLTNVWRALKNRGNIDWGSTIAEVNEIGQVGSGLSLKLCSEILGSLDHFSSISASTFGFLFQNLSPDYEGLIEGQSKAIASAILKHQPKMVWDYLLSKSDLENKVAINALELMGTREIIENTKNDLDLFELALKFNPGILTSTLIWKHPDTVLSIIFKFLSSRKNPDTAILTSMFSVENAEVTEIGLEIFGQRAVEKALKYYENDNGRKQKSGLSWIVAAKKYPGLLEASIREKHGYNLKTLAMIASLTSYDRKPKSAKKDEWATAMINSEGDTLNTPIELSVFLLARALSGVSPEPGSLIHFSFDRVNRALNTAAISSDSWSILEKELPPVEWWKEWNKGHRLRSGIIDMFVKQRIGPEYFFSITQDNFVFSELVELASHSSKGRRYLEELKPWLGDTEAKIPSKQAAIVSSVFKYYRKDRF